MDIDLRCGDCIDVMQSLRSASVQMILSDLPYGSTANKWDSVIPFDRMWSEFLRVCTPNAAVVLTASQPFTSALVQSQPALFRHEWIWIKNKGSNFANTGRAPMKEHESVLVFSRGKWTYNRQMQGRNLNEASKKRIKTPINVRTNSGNYAFGKQLLRPAQALRSELRVPSSWQRFDTEVGLHPTQKPVLLMRYMIRTYSNPGDTVLDVTMGSGTSGVAALLEGRKFIGIEKDEGYFAIASERIEESQKQQRLFA